MQSERVIDFFARRTVETGGLAVDQRFRVFNVFRGQHQFNDEPEGDRALRDTPNA